MGIPVEVDEDALREALNEKMATIVLESYLGKNIKETIVRAVGKAINGEYGSGGIVQGVANEVVRRITFEELNNRTEELQEKIREVLTDEFVAERIKEVTSNIRVVTTE